ncbi:hypothetical protein BKA70DRAFT_1554328 [Coprinopsis sp. MPI-PUGE-AT-0042]|nr:hypothetical protein BKA70DRAFT_1554328 [Coprinopsis sp. MPI-PUGE-AT-0042]
MTKDTTNKTHGQAKKSESKIPKPPNSFILWKNQLCPDTTMTPRQRLRSMPEQAVFQCLLEIHGFLNYLQAGSSKLNGGAWVSATGRWWRSLTDEERQPWEDEAKRRVEIQIAASRSRQKDLPIAMRLLRGSDQTGVSNTAATQTSYEGQAHEHLNQTSANGPVPAQASHQHAATPPRDYLGNPSPFADQHGPTSHQLAYYPGMMQQMFNPFEMAGRSSSFQVSGTGFRHDNQVTGARNGFNGSADGQYQTLTAPEIPQVNDQSYFSFPPPPNGLDTVPDGVEAEIPDGNTSFYSTAYSEDNVIYTPVQTTGGPYSGSLHDHFRVYGYQNAPYEADENQMPGSVAGLYNPAFNQTQGAFEGTTAYAVTPVALQAMQSIESHGVDRPNEWSSQLESLSMTSPFDGSGRTTPEDVQEGPASTAMGWVYGHPEAELTSCTYQLEAPGPPMPSAVAVGDVSLAYSQEEMAAFDLNDDPADFNLSGFTYNEPEGFERSAGTIAQSKNNTTTASGSQWDLGMF